MGDYTLEQALALASENADNTLDDAIHVNIDTREVTVPQSQQLFGVESDADVEIKHIVIDGRYADGNRDLSELAWRVVYCNANKETSYYLIPSVVANENSIEMDWLIKRSVVAYKGTVDFILCAFATTSSGEVTPEWNTTLGHGTVLEGLETSAIDIGKESVDELAKILYETIAARDIAKKASENALSFANRAFQSEQASANIKQEIGTLSEEKKQEISELTDTKIKVLQEESTTQQAAIEKKGKDILATIPEDYTKVSNDVSQLKEDVTKLKAKKAEIDDTAVGANAWSSKHIVDMLCPPIEESGNPVVCYPVAGYPLGVKAKWEPVQEGSGTPSPENIRPIKGLDSVTVTRCGENLASNVPKSPTQNTICTIFKQKLSSATITISGHIKGTYAQRTAAILDLYDSQNGIDNYITPSMLFGTPNTTLDNDFTYTTTKSFDEIALFFMSRSYTQFSIDSELSNFSIVYGTTAPTTYTPYNGQNNTLTLPETVYGGEVDAVTGEGKRTWGIINNYAGETISREWISDRDVYSADKNPTVGAKVAYRLAEPVPFTATGAQPITALSGANTILTDADSETVTGRADPIKRITDLEDAVASQT